MSKIKPKSNYLALLKWVVLPALALAFWGNSGSQEVLQTKDFQDQAHAIVHQAAIEKAPFSDLSSNLNDFEYFEIEEEDNDDDDQQYTNGQSNNPESLLLMLHASVRFAQLPPLKKIKLFILFHSWKSFLLL